MVDKGRRLIASGGAGLMVSGAALLFTAGAAPAQAAGAHHGSHAPVSAPNCGNQPNRDDPTNTLNKALASYYFQVVHGGAVSNVCTLLHNVRAGDMVTAFFTLHTGASQATQLSLVSYQATDETPAQTMFDCASFGVSSGSCVSTTASALTVHVPPCGFQVDLIYGAPSQLNNQGSYLAAHVWINGSLGSVNSGETVCTNATPTPTPTPTSSVLGITTVATPSTGAGSSTQGVLGILLMTLGGSAVVYAGRRLRTTEV